MHLVMAALVLLVCHLVLFALNGLCNIVLAALVELIFVLLLPNLVELVVAYSSGCSN